MKSLLLAVLLLASALPAQTLPPSPAKSPAAAATELIDHLAKAEFQAAAANFAEAMRAAAPPEKLSEIWTAVQGQLGAYKRRTGVQTEKQGPYEIALVTAEFERGTVDFKVAVDNAGRVAGFFIVPPQQAGSQASGYTPPPYAHKDAFKERDFVVGSGEWSLPGTLTMPVGAGPFPAVVLVHGSGPNDRDESVGAEKPFRDLAWGLASRGIAVLRYEKRTREHGSKLAAVKDFTVQQETVDDALAAAALLRRTEGVDPRRVFVLGHSLGAMMAPRIGQRDPQLAGLVVMAGATRPLEDIILEQVSYLAGADGTVTDAEKKQIESLRAEVAKVKALKPGDAGVALGAPASYWLDLRGYDPAAAARSLKQPLLILQGGRDYQVTPDSLEAWRKAVPGATFKTYPKLNHLFIEGEGKSLPQEYDKPGHVAEEVIVDLVAWIKR